MVIQTGDVSMTSYYKKSTYKAESVNYTSWGNSGVTKSDADAKQALATLPTATDSAQTKNGLLQRLENSNMYDIERLLSENEETKALVGEDKVEEDSLDNLMLLLFGRKLEDKENVSPWELFRRMMSEYQERLETLLINMGNCYGIAGASSLGTSIAPTQQQWVEELTITDLYQETETSKFYSSGNVVTEDGRTIEFDISVTMSRSFMQYTDVSIDYKKITLIDPLVINLGEDSAKVSDQKFLFDIDTDGDLDNISLLGELCGYLALDKNEDGTINNGSELFGTQTGDGFAELKIYDMDDNGWIDEKDEIFNKLRIWKKDDKGNDKLVALGVAGVGAVYLGSLSTKFSLNKESTNETNAVIQRSGVYLTEEGRAKTIQHLDLASEQT